MVDGQRGKAQQVDDRRGVLLDLLEQPRGGPVLMAAHDRHHDAPVAAHDVGAPGPTALFLEQGGARPAQLAQPREAGNHHPALPARRLSLIPVQHRPDDAAVGRVAGRRSLRIEAGVVEELSRGADQHEAAVHVVRRGLAPAEDGGRGGWIEVVLPDQLVGKREGVALQLEAAAGGEHLP